MKKNFAFTLAEVLMTLAIIGIISVMIMPSINYVNYRKKTDAIEGRKLYGVVRKLTAQILIKEKDFKDLQCSNVKEANECFKYQYTKRMGVNVDCPQEICFSEPALETFLIDKKPSYVKLKDSSIMGFAYLDSGCRAVVKYKEMTDSPIKVASDICGVILYDVNGSKPPNKLGEDRFCVAIGEYGIKEGIEYKEGMELPKKPEVIFEKEPSPPDTTSNAASFFGEDGIYRPDIQVFK